MPLRSYADGALFAEVLGEGRPRVLALHGWGRRGRDFAPSLEGVAAIAPDLPGFGATPPPLDVIGARGYADVVRSLLPEFDAPPVVVGHSFGGRIAVCLAASEPDRVGPLVLTGVPLLRRERPGKPALAHRLARALNRWGLLSDRRLEEEKRKRGSADYRAASGLMRDILVKVVNEDYQDELSRLQSEVLLMWGELDKEVPVETAILARDLLERSGVPARLEIMIGAGHHIPVERPADLRAALVELLQ